MQILRHHPPHPMPTRQDRLRLGMMHLSPNGLSEQWLLRHLGDRHWDLIAAAVGQEGIAFRDADGAQVYAAFCATSLDLPGQARARNWGHASTSIRPCFRSRRAGWDRSTP